MSKSPLVGCAPCRFFNSALIDSPTRLKCGDFSEEEWGGIRTSWGLAPLASRPSSPKAVEQIAGVAVDFARLADDEALERVEVVDGTVATGRFPRVRGDGRLDQFDQYLAVVWRRPAAKSFAATNNDGSGTACQLTRQRELLAHDRS